MSVSSVARRANGSANRKKNTDRTAKPFAGYSTARWDLTTRLYELAIFAWDHGVVTRAAKGFAVLSVFFFLFALPFARLATEETDLVGGH